MLRGFLKGDFLRLSPWSGGLGQVVVLAGFVVHCESYAQDIKNAA